ncbi:elongator complex protein 6 isoform X3 [Homo sapiens]|uniref:elongator complex protein 6 isoform X3 n=1 Tax=Homo sapiens TaxID=9606 RepID=UPI0005CFFBAA|nr:elongator complex protein 6 isoform X3 [Homo sapiens]XP_054202963.1 elongator complex protein 6 isoform X3 [Homo sapiens]|eukprot:XP_011532155.1 elongator complex protein 6 isoform X3 [Homo sapiens]
MGKLTLLCDAKTDGSFLVHHFLSFYLKANCKVCFVALIQSFSHYSIVGQKLGVSLTMARERGQLVFLEGLKSAVDVVFQAQKEPHPLQFLREANAGNLKPLFEFVREALKPVDSGEARWTYPVLLVDDLSVLLSLGMGAVAVLDFIHYCRATVCWELKVLMELPSLRPPVTSKNSDRSRPHLLAVIFLFAWGFGFTLAGPESFCSHPVFPYLPLLKSKAPQNKGMINIAFSGAGYVWHRCSPRSVRIACVSWGKLLSSLSVFYRSAKIMSMNYFKIVKGNTSIGYTILP